jgi:hypothetical protein
MLRGYIFSGDFVMKMIHTCSLALAILISAGTVGFGQTNYQATLTAAQETSSPSFTMSGGGARPVSFGDATFTLNASMTQLSMTVTVTNIDVTGSQTPGDTNDNLTNAHIHAAAPPGSATGVVWGFIGMPFNDNNPTQGVMTPFASGVGGTFTSIWDAPEGNSTTLSAQLSNLNNGLAYINFHTSQNGGGEIRGQIILVPEPATTVLLALGVLSGATAVWKRRLS